MLLNHCLSLRTQNCLVRETFRWKLKGGDLKLVIILLIKIYLGYNLHQNLKTKTFIRIFCLYVANAHPRPCAELKTWVRSTMTGERLCGFAMLHFHRNMAVNRENVLRRYNASGHRKIGKFCMEN